MLEEILEKPSRLKALTKHEIVTSLLQEAIDKNKLKEYLSVMDQWAILAFVMAHPHSVYSVKELFDEQFGSIMEEPKYEYGSQTLVQCLLSMDKLYDSGSILKPNVRKSYLYRAAETPSRDDYKVFTMIFYDEFPEKLFAFMETESCYGLGKNGAFIKNHLTSSVSLDNVKSIPADIFTNNTNSVRAYHVKEKLSLKLFYHNVIIDILPNDAKVPNTLKRYTFGVTPDNQEFSILLFDGSSLIGGFYHGEFVLTKSAVPSVVDVSEHMFNLQLCESGGKQDILIVSDNNRVIGNVSSEYGTLHYTTKKVKSFTVSVLPYCNYSGSIITCTGEDDKPFYVFALTKDTEHLGKTRKTFNLIQMGNKYFYNKP